jgi:hypothetical protein
VSRLFLRYRGLSWKRSTILAEIYLCHACSCHEILRRGGNKRRGRCATTARRRRRPRRSRCAAAATTAPKRAPPPSWRGRCAVPISLHITGRTIRLDFYFVIRNEAAAEIPLYVYILLILMCVSHMTETTIASG